MNSHEQDNSNGQANEREFGEVIEQLDRMADVLDRQRYPGEAWPVRRVHRRKMKLLWRVSAGASAAAAIILLAILVHPTPPKRATPTQDAPANDQLVENGWQGSYNDAFWGFAGLDSDLDEGEYEIADVSDAATDVLFDIYNPPLPAEGKDAPQGDVPNTTWPAGPDANGNGNGNGSQDS